MYSVSFAITVIFCIAVTNLFLGFTAALLIGQGPRRPSGQGGGRFAVRWLPASWISGRLSGSRKTATPAAAEAAAPGDPARPTDPPSSAPPARDTRAVEPAPEPGEPAEDRPLQQAAAAPADTEPTPAKTVVLTLADEPPPADDRSPEQVLQDELSALGPDADPAVDPSATILYVERADETITDSQWIKILDAIEQTVKGQLRRDRQVLSFSIGEFVWFTGDTPVEDALLPAERIRQVLANTRYQSGEQPLPVRIATAVVHVAPHDDPQQLLFRLRQAVEFSGSQSVPHTAIDQGDGPEPTQPIDLQVAERTQQIDG